MVACCPQGVLASGHRAEACWLPTGSADRGALQEFPGAGGLQHATDGEQALLESMSRDAILLVSALGQIPLQPPELDSCTHFVAGCKSTVC